MPGVIIIQLIINYKNSALRSRSCSRPRPPRTIFVLDMCSSQGQSSRTPSLAAARICHL